MGQIETYSWRDRDDDVTGSVEAWEVEDHPRIVCTLRLALDRDAAIGRGTVGIHVDRKQARELAAVFTKLADAHR